MTVRHRIISFPEIPSTHAHAKAEGPSLEEGTVIVADYQTEGRGRRGREWISPPGEALLFSILLKPGMPPSEAPLATALLALAVTKFLCAMGLKARLRWPNDVVVGEAKVAGILAEAILSGERLDYIVVSAGLNVNQNPKNLSGVGQPATSIFAETEVKHQPASLLEPLLDLFDKLYETFLDEGFPAIAPEWKNLMELEGKTIALDFGGRIVQGRVRGFGDDGSIEIEEDDGSSSRHLSGEVVKLSLVTERKNL